MSNIRFLFFVAFISIIIFSCNEAEEKVEPKPDKDTDLPEILEAPDGYEPIVFALNSRAADFIPNWKEKAKQAIDSVNKIYLKTTDKKYFISKYVTYYPPITASVYSDSFYHMPNDTDGRTAVFLYVIPEGEESVEHRIPHGSSHAYYGSIGGVTHQTAFIVQNQNFSILDLTDKNYDYWDYLATLVHELGHTNGLASPDWYLYEFEDITQVKPVLDPYYIRDEMKLEPMAFANDADMRFGEFNSFVINANLDHQYTFDDIKKMRADTCKVLVTDSNQVPISDVKIDVYCVAKACWFCSDNDEEEILPDETIYTDSLGFATYEGPSGDWDQSQSDETGCMVKVLKVHYNDTTQSKYVKYLDLQKDLIMDSLNTHIDHFIF